MLTDLYYALPNVIITSIIVISLLIGSFITMVVYRLPHILHRQWKNECDDYIREAPATINHINFCAPSSHCCHCQRPLRLSQMVPILSYLIYRGRCGFCKKGIPLRYLFIEITVLVTTIITLWHFQLSIQLAPALLLTWIMITLAYVDIHSGLLPDVITLPSIWLGLLINTQSLFCAPVDAIWGAGAAYVPLYLMTKLVSYVTKKQQMSHGDFKCLAIGGAWFGYQNLPKIVLFAAVCGCIHVAIRYLRGRDVQQAIPFGPYLSLATWLYLIIHF